MRKSAHRRREFPDSEPAPWLLRRAAAGRLTAAMDKPWPYQPVQVCLEAAGRELLLLLLPGKHNSWRLCKIAFNIEVREEIEVLKYQTNLKSNLSEDFLI